MKIVQPVVDEVEKIKYTQYDDINKQISAGKTQGGRKEGREGVRNRGKKSV